MKIHPELVSPPAVCYPLPVLPENNTAPVMYPNGCNRAVCFHSKLILSVSVPPSKRWLPVYKVYLTNHRKSVLIIVFYHL